MCPRRALTHLLPKKEGSGPRVAVPAPAHLWSQPLPSLGRHYQALWALTRALNLGKGCV